MYDCTRCYQGAHQHHGFVQQSSGQSTGLRVGQPRFQSWPGQGIVPLRHAGKKMQAPLLGLAKSIYYYRFTAFHRCISVSCLCQDTKNVDIFILVSSQSDQHLIFPYNITPGSHINPLTPMSDQDRISPYNINTVSIR